MIIVDKKFGLFVNPNDANYNNSNKVHDIPNIHIYQMHASLFNIFHWHLHIFVRHISAAIKVIRLQ